MITEKQVYVPSRNAAFRQIANEWVIVDTLNNRLLSLNETGGEIWSVLDGRTVKEISAHIAEIFDVQAVDALRDTISFLNDLQSRSLIEVKS